jgi:hypothetical protein
MRGAEGGIGEVREKDREEDGATEGGGSEERDKSELESNSSTYFWQSLLDCFQAAPYSAFLVRFKFRLIPGERNKKS